MLLVEAGEDSCSYFVHGDANPGHLLAELGRDVEVPRMRADVVPLRGHDVAAVVDLARSDLLNAQRLQRIHLLLDQSQHLADALAEGRVALGDPSHEHLLVKVQALKARADDAEGLEFPGDDCLGDLLRLPQASLALLGAGVRGREDVGHPTAEHRELLRSSILLRELLRQPAPFLAHHVGHAVGDVMYAVRLGGAQVVQNPGHLEERRLLVLAGQHRGPGAVQSLAQAPHIVAEGLVDVLPGDALANVVPLRRGHIAAVVHLALRHFLSGQLLQHLGLCANRAQDAPHLLPRGPVAAGALAVGAQAEHPGAHILETVQDVPDGAEAHRCLEVHGIHELRGHGELALA
mmetsp:Transcript_97450/g.280461  ORF Transcript_97450/g.280461 Transcript_97450/m.280461 type:complete len:348 (+) Transcript_97450:211-1254(+)